MRNEEVYRNWYERRGRLIKIRLGMIDRCCNPNNRAYPRYGGRGIRICDEWLNDKESFINWALNHGYNSDLSIDRIDNDGDYTPGNCRWADRRTQANNTSANSRYNYEGEMLTLREISNKYGYDYELLSYRVQGEKWNIYDAINKAKKEKHYVTINGVTKPLRTWARECEVKRNTAYNRFNKGMSIEDVLRPDKYSKDEITKKTNFDKYKSERYEYEGEYYTLNELANKFNITPQCLAYRIKDMGMDIHEALKYPSKKQNWVIIDGITKTLSEWCKERGISRRTVYERFNMGLSMEEALNPQLNSPNGQKLRSYIKLHNIKPRPESERIKFASHGRGIER